MNFEQHLNLKGKHSIFGPSSSVGLIKGAIENKEDLLEKCIDKYNNRNRTALGTELHDYADTKIKLRHRITGSPRQLIFSIQDCIYSKYKNLNQEKYGEQLVNSMKYLPDVVFETISAYVNDAIFFKLEPEILLYYTDEIFGTADAISFTKNQLRIHDLKTGDTPAHIEQLIGYAALFCLQYSIKPGTISYELRLYQLGDVLIFNPTAEEVLPVMDMYMAINKKLNKEI